ncbi:hypothetical protein [Novosphingobium sp. BW1]|uniref:hypothetical protein n=1 Tax=Novosphingobium sp. BW1 TaxID=2592621 RepID=UPI001292F916|nr:hypothetical protein [Novosphingobium sp. BW1]
MLATNRTQMAYAQDPVPYGKGPFDNSNPDPGVNPTLYEYLGGACRVGVRINM